MIVDTGSSDTYFDATSAPTCQTDGAYDCKGGTFSPARSSTYEEVAPAPAFDTRYGDGSTASGPFADDVVCISDICISNVQFGLATQVKSTTGYALGLMGLGYSLNEATALRHLYPNIPEVLVEAGVINSRLYSVYLNDWQSTSGSVLFGGIDTSKYRGPLQTVNILPDLQVGGVFQFVTTVTDFSVTVDGDTTQVWTGGAAGVGAYASDTPSLPVLLDTGSAAWSVPPGYYREIVSYFPYVQSQGLCRCSDVDPSDTITLTFDGLIDITVPASEFIVPIYNRTTTEEYETAGGADQCIMMIVPSEGTGMGFDTLGDAVLRSMYVVYDLDNGQMSLAQANVGSDAAPDVQVVEAGPNGVRDAADRVRPAVSSQTFPIANTINATVSHVVSTARTTVGAATGTAAVPADAEPNSTGSSGSSDSSGAAMGLRVPAMDWSGVWVMGTAVLMAGLGAGLMI